MQESYEIEEAVNKVKEGFNETMNEAKHAQVY